MNKIQIQKENGTSSTWTVCSQCLAYLKTVSPGSDLTMKILYRWALQCGNTPQLPNSLKKDCLKMAELVYHIDRKLNNEIRPKMKDKQYPRFLKEHEEKDAFIQWLKNDEGIKNILHDVNSGDERKNLSLRSWAGLKEAAKTLRKTKVSSQGEVEYTIHDRELEFEEIDQNAMQDEIYRAAVEAAPIHELNKVSHKQIYLDGVPCSSVVWRYIKKKKKNVKIIRSEDLEEDCKAVNARVFDPFVIDMFGNVKVMKPNANYTITGTEKYVNSGWLLPKGQEKVFPGSSNTFTVTFKKVGKYDYFCMVHPWMVGTVIVK